MDNEILLKLYSLYQKELYLYLYSFCGDRHLAEDLLHETFLKALLALPDGHTNMRAWLYMVARNLFYNQQKKKSQEILMEEQECFPEKNRDEDLLEKILEEEIIPSLVCWKCTSLMLYGCPTFSKVFLMLRSEPQRKNAVEMLKHISKCSFKAAK